MKRIMVILLLVGKDNKYMPEVILQDEIIPVRKYINIDIKL
jgi:hypothetical protein